MRRVKQLIWPLIMASYGVAILVLMMTDELKAYIHPKLHLLTFSAMAILFVLAMETARETFKKDTVPRLRKTYIIFIIPLLFFFINADGDASRQVAIENGIKMSAIATESSDEEVTTELVTEVSNEELLSEQDAKTKTVIEEDGVIYLTDLNFAEMMEEIFVNLEDYKGKKLSYVGLIHKEAEGDTVMVVVGRLLMYCCAADAQLIGIQAESPLIDDYISGDWARVTGTIDETEYVDTNTNFKMNIPLLKVEAIEPAEEPADPYVYFNN